MYIHTATGRRNNSSISTFKLWVKKKLKNLPFFKSASEYLRNASEKTLEEQFENDCTSIAQGWRTRLYPWADFSPDQGSTTDHSKPKLKMGSQSCGKLPESSHGLWCLHTKMFRSIADWFVVALFLFQAHDLVVEINHSAMCRGATIGVKALIHSVLHRCSRRYQLFAVLFVNLWLNRWVVAFVSSKRAQL